LGRATEPLPSEGSELGRAEGEAKGRAEGEAKGLAEGEAKGEAKTVLAVLEARGLRVTAAQRERVLACTDLAQLEGWVRKAVTVKTTAELFTPAKRPVKARR
jgi:predicted transposase YdaD